MVFWYQRIKYYFVLTTATTNYRVYCQVYKEPHHAANGSFNFLLVTWFHWKQNKHSLLLFYHCPAIYVYLCNVEDGIQSDAEDEDSA